MRRGAFPRLSLAPLAASLLAITPLVVGAQDTIVQRSRLSASYNVSLRIGPAVTVVAETPGARPTTSNVEIALPGPDGSPPSLESQRQSGGQAPNRHLDVTVFVITSGAVVTNPAPTVTLVHSDGSESPVSRLLPMQGLMAGRHFGTNLYLADGTYTVNVEIAGERVSFTRVELGISGGAAPAATPLPTPQPQPTPAALPKNGDAAGDTWIWLLALGGALLGLGALWRRRPA